MTKRAMKFIILLLVLSAPVLLLADSKKTDNTLAAQIEQKLAGVAPNTVIIVVDEATRTAFLRGSLPSQAEIDLITETVRSIDDVRIIGTSLVVAAPGTTGAELGMTTRTIEVEPPDDTTFDEEIEETRTIIATTDASLRAAVEQALKSEGIMGQSKIKVATENGVVTLTGTALSEAHADRIVALAQSVSGVVGVKTNIQLRDEKRIYKVKPSFDRDKEGREVDEGQSRVDDDDDL